MLDPLLISATEQRRALSNGRLTAEALMQATLDRIQAVNSKLNALVFIRDASTLLSEAKAADATEPIGPLHGLPLAVKDLADVAGLPTSQGSPIFEGQIAEADSPHVARLRAAGAIIIGKTNTPEFGLGGHTYNQVFEPCRNPYDASRSCGGSSGGAAVALATGMTSLADGSDMMGSLRNPAGWNNLYGFRPSWGRVPGAASGDMFLHRLSTSGPMGRCPADIALLLDAMSGPLPHSPQRMPFTPVGEPSVKINSKRIGWLGDWGGAWPVEDGILPLCEKAFGAFEQAGAHVERVPPPFSAEALWHSWTTLRSWSIARELVEIMDQPEKAAQLKPEAVWEAERGLNFSAMDVHRASEIRSEWYRTADQLFEIYDALILPTAQVWPFPIEWPWPKNIAGQRMDTYHRWMELTIPAGLIGLPVAAVPAGFGESGLPMGLQILGRDGDDKGVLELAEAYHRETLWPERRPALTGQSITNGRLPDAIPER
ncbi:MAG: amidase [Pseudomonadota bacterium]